MSTPAFERSGYFASMAATISAERPSFLRNSFADAAAAATERRRPTPLTPPALLLPLCWTGDAMDAESLEAADEAKVGACSGATVMAAHMGDADAPTAIFRPTAAGLAVVAKRAALILVRVVRTEDRAVTSRFDGDVVAIFR